MATWAVLAASSLLTSCVATLPKNEFCLTQTPHRFGAQAIAAMTTEELRQEVEFNRYGEATCGWKP
jgi:hypothetical protein